MEFVEEQTDKVAEVKPMESWVKKTMTVSLSKSNIEVIQQFVAGIPIENDINNISKLLLYTVENCSNATKVAEKSITELQEKNNALLDLTTQLQSDLDNKNKRIDELQNLLDQQTQTTIVQPTKTDKPTTKLWFE